METIAKMVTVHGHAVSLPALKGLLRERGIDANALVATARSGGVVVNTAHITAQLSGRDPMLDYLKRAIEVHLPEPEVRALAQPKKKPVVQPLTQTLPTTVPANTASVPAFARTMGAIPDDPHAPPVGMSQLLASKAAAALARPEFPMDLAFKVAAMVRKSHGTEVSATFSLRKMQQWAEAYLLALRAGFSQAEAVASGFHMAVLAKEYGEHQTYLSNAFNTVFNLRPELPAFPAAKIAADGNRHPMSYLLEPLLRDSKNVWLAGDTGTGKTFMVKDLITRVLGREVLRIQGTGDMNVDDLLGFKAGKDGTTFFEYGPLPLCMGRLDGKGKTLLIDEPTTAHADVLFELQAVLEGDDLVLKKNGGERITACPGFNVVVCDNTVGLGERPEYVGTKVMNESFRDRFLFLHVDYMPEAQEKAIVAAFLNEAVASRTLTLVPEEAVA